MEDLITSIQNTFPGMSTLVSVLLIVTIVVISLLAFYFIRIHIAYRMAVNRHRDPIAWALLSFFVSPILTWIILLIVGDAHK